MTNAKLLVVADDFTGGLDTGVQFARQGIATRVVVNPDGTGDWTQTDGEVLVAVAVSRHLSPEAAYATVFRIVAEARRAGIPYVYKKTDSALRGNIGAELSATLRASGADMLFFLPAFPRLGRTTAGGRHYIDGVPVSASVFGRDPLNPVPESDVRQLIATQTDVPVSNAAPDTLTTGRGICVVDAQSDADLKRAGAGIEAMGALSVSAGCAGFAAFLPSLLRLKAGSPPAMPALGDGLMVICGSVNPITRRQLDWAQSQGFARLRLTPAQKLEGDAIPLPLPGTKWLILDANDPDPDNAPTLAHMRARGYDLDEARRRITASLAEALAAVEPEWPGALLITGGDTLIRCLTRLGAHGIEPMLELFPGVVLSKCGLSGRDRFVISKSGGFGRQTLLTDLQELIQRA